MANLPLAFEANRGQANASVKFISRGNGATLLLTAAGAVLQSQRSSIDLKFTGANPKAKVSGADQLPEFHNYLIGNEPSVWQTNVTLSRR
jgi:hypothetical protein